MCGCVKCDFPLDLRHAICKLYAFLFWITSKEIHTANIPWWHQEIVEIVWMFEKELLMTFMDLQVHILIHLVDEVELVGVVSCRWMFFLERYMKKLKGFVRQRAKLEGSMAEAYISYSTMPVSTSSRSTTDQVLWFGTIKWMKTKEKESCSKRVEKSAC